MSPLTHHEILTLIEPFTRSGRHVDLETSDRRERRLAFKPVVHPADAAMQGMAEDRLVLENPETGCYRLTRTLTSATGLTATLWAEGTDPGALLEGFGMVAPSRQLMLEAGVPIARSYRLAAATTSTPTLTEAEARIGTIRITFDAQTARDGQIAVRICPQDGDGLQLPADFLAILGPAWDPLRPDDDAWRGMVRTAEREPERSQDGERKISQAVAHLAGSLTQPPSAFHHQFSPARRSFFWRRNLLILGEVGVLGLGPAVHMLDLPEESTLFMLSYFWPTLLLMALPLYVERLVFSPPAWPRPLPETAWRPIALASLAGPAR